MVINTFGTWHASVVELRSRMDGRYQPEPAACSRTLPMASDAVACLGLSPLGTRKYGIRAVESFLSPRFHVNGSSMSALHQLERTIIGLSPTRKKNLRASGPNVLPRIAFSNVFGFRVFLNLGLSFSLYFLLFVFVRLVLYFFVARVSVSVFGICMIVCARASVFICISGCILKWESGPPREKRRRHPDCSIQTSTQ